MNSSGKAIEKLRTTSFGRVVPWEKNHPNVTKICRREPLVFGMPGRDWEEEDDDAVAAADGKQYDGGVFGFPVAAPNMTGSPAVIN